MRHIWKKMVASCLLMVFVLSCSRVFTVGMYWDECAFWWDNNCHDEANCTNTNGSYYCTCKNGYSGNGTDCFDIDECKSETHGCDAVNQAICTNTQGNYTCACKFGFTGNGINCADIDECRTGTHGCDVSYRATCINTQGNYSCACKSGYMDNGNSCIDIDECRTGAHRCDVSYRATCTNTEGNYTCACKSGFTGDGSSCIDIDECAIGTHECEEADQETCRNSQRGYYCDCKEGFTGYNWHGYDYWNGNDYCSDWDECAYWWSNICHDDANCTNTNGSYYCTCKNGYSGNGINCFDLNECESGAHECSSNADCVNDRGSYSCICRVGYTGDGITCTDLRRPWGKWSECSSSCSTGIQVRKRVSVVGLKQSNETRSCNTDLCNAYSKDKITCTGKGNIPNSCKLRALIESQLEMNTLAGSSQELYQSADGKLKAKITKFQAPGMNLKLAQIRKDGKNGN